MDINWEDFKTPETPLHILYLQAELVKHSSPGGDKDELKKYVELLIRCWPKPNRCPIYFRDRKLLERAYRLSGFDMDELKKNPPNPNAEKRNDENGKVVVFKQKPSEETEVKCDVDWLTLATDRFVQRLIAFAKTIF